MATPGVVSTVKTAGENVEHLCSAAPIRAGLIQNRLTSGILPRAYTLSSPNARVTQAFLT